MEEAEDAARPNAHPTHKQAGGLGMPSGSLEAAPLVVRTAVSLKPRRVLDLGMGTGKYGFLIREQLDLALGRSTLTLVGVEGYEDYIRDHQRVVYDEIVVADFVDYLRYYEGECFDLTLLLDVIEHLDPETGVAAVRNALEISRFVMIATPTSYYAQRDPMNELETHRSWWPRRQLAQLAGRCEAQIAFARVVHTNVALLSKHDQPVLAKEGRFRPIVRSLRDLVISEKLYYRLRGSTGPTI
jgi:hypothetical protein